MTRPTAAPIAAEDDSQPAVSKPLAGVVVVDLGQQFAAPYATLLLALAGAEVVKVEPLDGEALRQRAEVKGSGAGLPFYLMNANKRGVTLNLKDDRGKELLREMADRAAVLVENFRPGVMDRLGLSPKALRARNPSLIYASGSGYGQVGIYSDLPAMDLTIQAMSGVVASTGFTDQPPVKAGPAVADFSGGIHLYGAIVTALYQRALTGRGARLDVAMLDAVYPSLMSNIGAVIGADNPPPERTGNRHGGLSVCPYSIYPTKDGHVAILCIGEHHWRALATIMGRPELVDDPRYATKPARVRVMNEVDAMVGEWSRSRDTETVFSTVRAGGIPCAPVRNLREVIDDPYFRERGLIQDQDVPGIGRLPLIHTPMYFADERRLPLENAPALGADNDRVYGRWLGHDADEIETLRREGVI